MAQTTSDNRTRDAKTRSRLAAGIVLGSIGGILVASVAAIWLADPIDRPDMASLVFTSVLPLLGTWVGTILAFYFARANLEAATESTIRLGGLSEPQTPVREVMIPVSNIDAYPLPAAPDPSTIGLSTLYNQMQTKGRHRIPLIESSGSVRYVVHDSTIAGFAKAEDPAATAKTLADLLADADAKKAIEAIGIVGPDANLGDARTAMRAVEGCNDVFVTRTGKRDDPIVGWLTNTELAGTR